MGYDPQQCLNNLNQKGLAPACQNLINPFHCDDVTQLDPALHAACATAGIYYFPVQCTVCTNGTSYQYFPSKDFFKDCAALGPTYYPAFCYCCCSCLANDTMIAVPDGEKQICTIMPGEQVLAASASSVNGKIKMNWSNADINFSSGTSSKGHQPMMVYLSLTGTNTHELICNMDQPFLLANGKYTKAEKLHPGQKLVDKDGNPVTVDLVSIGSYDGGVHHISTNKPWNKNADGHLLLAGGIVAGDYTLQLHFNDLPKSMREDDYDVKPSLGTKEYDKAYTANGKFKKSDALFEFTSMPAPSAKSAQAAQPTAQRQMVSGLFKTYRVETSPVPYGAQAFFTPGQAADIAEKGSQAPLSNPIPLALFNTVKAQLAGFYPDIDFYYDTLDVTPNVYAFEAYGRKIVQVSGGLARMQGFNYEGLFMAMAHGVSCFVGGAPKNNFGYSAVGQSDWYAFGVISRMCWIGNPNLTYAMAAMKQWNDLFALVSPENAKGNPQDPLNDPALACRYQTIQTAAAGGSLPECAGGTPLPKIALQRATATSAKDVVLTFSLAVDNETGSNIANYSLSPTANVISATLDAATGFIVHLVVDMQADTDYVVTAKNLESILGTGLDPKQSSTSFKSLKQTQGVLVS